MEDDEEPLPYSSCSHEQEQEQHLREIVAGIFYGSPRGVEQPFSITSSARESTGPLWMTFARQEQALQSVDFHGRALPVFAYQDHITGQRRFLATTYLQFWKRYQMMQPSLRHHYEIIREKVPCHLYFDLEFNRHTNQNADGDVMVDLLLNVVASTFYVVFRIPYDVSWTLELDSSTADKFSRHLILPVPSAAFRNNSHTGAFVAHVCSIIHERRGHDKRLNQLYVYTDQFHVPRLFIDQSVYSRNRSFRLVFSAKAGQTAILVPTYRFSSGSRVVMDDFATFMHALICNVDTNCGSFLVFDQLARSEHEQRHTPLASISKPTGAKESPFGAVDAFIRSISSSGNVPGKIRNWRWFQEFGIIVYSISGNRFCERIGRQHKSNNVMYVVSLRTARYYQKCHDPDCRGYKSPSRPLPQAIVEPCNRNLEVLLY